MIDILAILLFFMLFSFSTESEIISVCKDLKLPFSDTAEKKPENVNIVAIAVGTILINGKEIISIPDIALSKEELITPLYEELQRYKEYSMRFANDMINNQFGGKVIIECDETIPFNILERVMYTCGQAEYNKIELAVYKKK
jgi:biopolymer transport protein ExbD